METIASLQFMPLYEDEEENINVFRNFKIVFSSKSNIELASFNSTFELVQISVIEDFINSIEQNIPKKIVIDDCNGFIGFNYENNYITFETSKYGNAFGVTKFTIIVNQSVKDLFNNILTILSSV